MATTLELRRRIKTAQNVSKTTRAMQMISASKLKRAQEAALAARPYVTKLTTIAKNLAPKKQTVPDDTVHPYMQFNTKTEKTLYVIISPDKGLCGGLVTNLVREYIKVKNAEKSLFITIGKKIEGSVASNNKNLLAAFRFGTTLPTYDQIFPIIEIINEQFLKERVKEVKLITTQFNTVFSQTSKVTTLLPVTLPQEDGKTSSGVDFRLYEPTPKELIPPLLKRYIEMELYQHLLESYASEQAARMIAMQNATDNARDIVNALKLIYNKVRQEKITNEILDISSAAVALNNEE